MSMVLDLIAAVVNAVRQIDDQMMKLRSFSNEIDKITQRVESAFSGSERQYGQQMLQQLALTKSQVSDSLARLQMAKEKLLQVRMK